jgi:hypothetical protein
MRGSTWLIALAATLLIGACGDDAEPVSGADPDQPVQAPAEPSPPGARSDEPAGPARCKRVSRRLVRRPLGRAHAIARRTPCPLRIVVQDGRSLPVTDDFSPSRINVRVERGKIAEILGLF